VVKMRMLWVSLFMMFSSLSWACDLSNQGGRNPVVYFGGNQSKLSDTQAWAERAGSGLGYGSVFDFQGYHLNDAPYNQAKVLQLNKAMIDKCVAAIKRHVGPVVLVGHSDGSWIIYQIAKQLGPAERAQLRLVSLDGNKVNPADVKGVDDLQCITSYASPSDVGVRPCSGNVPVENQSLYFKEMSECGSIPKASCSMLPVKDCQREGSTNKMCLHFKLANFDVSPAITGSDYGATGYRAVAPPLFYLHKYSPTLTNDTSIGVSR